MIEFWILFLFFLIIATAIWISKGIKSRREMAQKQEQEEKVAEQKKEKWHLEFLALNTLPYVAMIVILLICYLQFKEAFPAKFWLGTVWVILLLRMGIELYGAGIGKEKEWFNNWIPLTMLAIWLTYATGIILILNTFFSQWWQNLHSLESWQVLTGFLFTFFLTFILPGTGMKTIEKAREFWCPAFKWGLGFLLATMLICGPTEVKSWGKGFQKEMSPTFNLKKSYKMDFAYPEQKKIVEQIFGDKYGQGHKAKRLLQEENHIVYQVKMPTVICQLRGQPGRWTGMSSAMVLDGNWDWSNRIFKGSWKRSTWIDEVEEVLSTGGFKMKFDSDIAKGEYWFKLPEDMRGKKYALKFY